MKLSTRFASVQHRRISRVALQSLEDRSVPALVATLVADINPGVAQSDLYLREVLGGTEPIAIMGAVDGTHGRELWATDGTEAGTVLVMDIYPGPDSSLTTAVWTTLNGVCYFAADDGTHGIELWRTDGTASGTYMVVDINAGPNDSNPRGRELSPSAARSVMSILNGRIYFEADDGIHGVELWSSDGTAAGTSMVADINPGVASSSPASSVTVGDMIFFTPNDGSHGTELWKTDGSTTTLVKDINPGTTSSMGILSVVNGVAVFTADDGILGNEPWRSDGTVAGTVILKDIVSGSASSSAQYATKVIGPGGIETAFFSAKDKKGVSRLWKTDGTAAGTVQPNANLSWSSIDESYLNPFGGTVFFSATDGSGTEVWKSDGTVAGTIRLTDNPGKTKGVQNSTPTRYITAVSGRVFFAGGRNETGYELWTSDGTVAGTYLIQDINPGVAESSPRGFIQFNDTVLFSAFDATNGRELWRIDDTSSLAPFWTSTGSTPTVPPPTVPAPIILAPQSSYMAMLAAANPDDDSALMANWPTNQPSSLLAVGMP